MCLPFQRPCVKFFRLQAPAAADTMAWPRPLRRISCGGTPGGARAPGPMQGHDGRPPLGLDIVEMTSAAYNMQPVRYKKLSGSLVSIISAEQYWFPGSSVGRASGC